MRFQCSNCHGIVSIDDADAGQPVACGFCERVVVVPASHFSPGAVINDFVIEREIGKGGVGTVYLAQQLSLARPVALKILHPRFSNDPEYVADFIREARAAAQLNHPVIVQAYAVGEEDGTFFFAMEYVEGATLKQILSHSGRMVWDRALMIIREVNEALNFAWSDKQLVHRDIKPDNIILTEAGTVKLADLGLARRAGDFLDKQNGEIMGTPQYISPEQLLRATVDTRSDLYSLGATFYHAVTGRFPYLGESPADTVQKHLLEALVPPRYVAGDIPEPVSRIIEIMMAKRPEHRYHDAAELALDLERVQNGQMPLHPLAPDSQAPCVIPAPAPGGPAVTSSAPLTAAVAPAEYAPVQELGAPAADSSMKTLSGNKRFVLKSSSATGKKPAEVKLSNTGRAPSATKRTVVLTGPLPGGERTATLVTPMADGTAEPPPRRRRRMSAKTMMVILSTFAGITLIVVIVLVVLGVREKNKTPEQREIEGLRKAFPKEQVEAFIAVRRMVRENAKAPEILAEVKRFAEQNPKDTELLEKIKALAAPLAEAEIGMLRREKHDLEKKEWLVRAKYLENQDRLAREAEAKQQQAAEEQLRLQQEEERRQRLKQQQNEELSQQQEQLRWDAIEKCRQGDFADARMLLIGMANSREEEFRNWARATQHTIELAEKAFTTVSGAKEALKGYRIVLPGRKGRWTVVSAGPREIALETTEIDVKTGDQVKKPLALSWMEMPSLPFLDLMEYALKKSGDTTTDSYLLGGAFLLARGDYLNLREARRRLTLTPLKEEAALMLAELAVIEPVIMDRQFALEMGKLRFLINKGDIQNANWLAATLKLQFPEQYQKAAEEIAKLLQDN